MGRIFRRKLLRPSPEGYLPRPRLLAETAPVRLLQVEAPGGAGKTIFLAQWLAARSHATLWYELDEEDADGSVFAAHLAAGLAALWPGWEAPESPDPVQLATELVAEAAARPPLDLALDRLEHAFGQPYLVDFLAVVLRYAPPGLTLALSSRAPLPLDGGALRRGLRTVTAADLALTPEEAGAVLGQGEWGECYGVTGGFPLALEIWRECGASWRTVLTRRAVAAIGSVSWRRRAARPA